MQRYVDNPLVLRGGAARFVASGKDKLGKLSLREEGQATFDVVWHESELPRPVDACGLAKVHHAPAAACDGLSFDCGSHRQHPRPSRPPDKSSTRDTRPPPYRRHLAAALPATTPASYLPPALLPYA